MWVLLSKLAGLWSLGKVTDGFMIRQLLTHIAGVIVLVVIAGTLAASLAVGLLYVFYSLLMQHGFDMLQSMSIVGLGVVLLLALLAMMIASRLKDIFHRSQFSSPAAGLPAEAMAIADAFVDGLLTKPVKSTR